MAKAVSDHRDRHEARFRQQDASAWITFDPDATGHRRDVRSAAAKSSAAARKATIARKLALNTACTGPKVHEVAPRKRRHERQDASPVSASPSSAATPYSRRQSEVSLASLATVSSPLTSSSNSPSYPGPSIWTSASPDALQTPPVLNLKDHSELQRAVYYILGIDPEFAQDVSIKEPTQFGALRIKSKAVSGIHDAVASRQSSSNTLLALALLAAWDIKFGDGTSSTMYLNAWHQLARPQNLPPTQDDLTPVNVPILEAIRFSLQRHLPGDVYANTIYVMSCAPYQQPANQLPQLPSGRQIVSFFDTLCQLVGTTTFL